MFLFHNLITPVILLAETVSLLGNFPSVTNTSGGRKTYRQLGSREKSGDGNTLFNDSVYFVLKVLPLIYSTVDFILGGSNCLLG